jgi:histidinol-phosphatase (PHP family)
MTIALTDYHVHTPLCRHAEGTPKEFVEAARRAGLIEIGFADHNPMPEHFDDWRMDYAELPRYLEFVEEARSFGFPVRLGLECDFISGREDWIEQLAGLTEWDYLIGSVHYLDAGWDVDNPKHLFRLTEDSIESVWDRYWNLFRQCVRSGLFDFVAHPDLPKKFGHRPKGDLRRYYEPAVEALQEADIAFEINTAGLRKPVNELYPAQTFLELAGQASVPVVINSDSHSPGEIGAGFETAFIQARNAGYRQVCRWSRRQRITVDL